MPERIETIEGMVNDAYAQGYRDARAKDAELIQRLVDALYALQFDEGNIIPAYHKADKAIEAAASAGFKPSEQ